MPLLYLAMAQDGRLTDDGMRQVATLAGITPAQVQAVASFYTMYKREVRATTSSRCAPRSPATSSAPKTCSPRSRTSRGSADGGPTRRLFTVEHVECIGACGGAPAMQVNYEIGRRGHPRSGARRCAAG